jgi:hypothetical protein
MGLSTHEAFKDVNILIIFHKVYCANPYHGKDNLTQGFLVDGDGITNDKGSFSFNYLKVDFHWFPLNVY